MAAVARFGTVDRFWRGGLFGTLVLASSVAVAQTPDMYEGCPDTAARIYLDTVGFITVNGHTVLPEDLSRTVASLKPREVCVAPVDSSAKPRPEIIAVLKAIAKLNLLVYFYTDRTFQSRAKPMLPSNNRWRGP